MRIKLLMVSLLLLSLLTACTEADTDTNQPLGQIAMETIPLLYDGTGDLFSIGNTRQLLAINNQTELESTFTKYPFIAPERQINFSEKQAIFIVFPEHGAGESFSVEVIDEYEHYIKAKVSYVRPGNNCIVIQIAISPILQLIEVSSRKELFFEENVVFQHCEPQTP